MKPVGIIVCGKRSVNDANILRSCLKIVQKEVGFINLIGPHLGSGPQRSRATRAAQLCQAQRRKFLRPENDY